MKRLTIFTIGHSNHSGDTFLLLMQNAAVRVVVDVRSSPCSRHVPQFNKKAIEALITGADMKYVYMGDILGGKPSKPEFLDAAGRVRYDRLAVSGRFRQGLSRLLQGLKAGWTTCLMCAEEDTLKCHRHHLLARELELHHEIPVWHIRKDTSLMRAKDYLQGFHTQLQLF